MKGVLDLLDSIENKHNLIISPGCDMPYDVPLEKHPLRAPWPSHRPEDARAMVANYTGVGFDDIEIDIPDYKSMDKGLYRAVHTGSRAVCRMYLHG